MWTQSTVLLFVLSSCRAVATEPQVFPQVCRRDIKKNCHCTLQEHLKFPAVQAGASWVGNWPLHPLISLSPFQTYCCWFWCSTWSNGKHYVFLFAKYGCDRGLMVWTVYMFALLHIALVKCFWEIWNLWKTRELPKHNMTLVYKCFVWFALKSALFGLKEWWWPLIVVQIHLVLSHLGC